MRTIRARMTREDAGAFAILYGLLVVVIVMTAAIVVDLSSLREDRRAARLATDAAATAGAIKLNSLAGTANARAACEEAWRFLVVNLPGAQSASAVCPETTFPSTFTACPSVARVASGDAGPWRVTITWPVPDSDSLMTTPNTTGVGDYRQPLDPAIDGTDPCGRLGVTVSRAREFVLAGVGGFTNATTSNSSVARAEVKGTILQEFPLVVLDQEGCDALLASGSATQEAKIEVLSRDITPGRLAMDSSGTASGNPIPGCDNGNSYVANTNGGGKIIAHSGSSGAKGAILSYAQPIEKAADPADLCLATADPSTVTRGICPTPVSFTRITRKFWDWQYHCTTATAEPLSAPCPYTATVPDHIGNLQNTLGTMTAANAASRGFTVWPATANDSSVCDYTASQYRYVPPGNYYVNCRSFRVNRVTVFGGGTLVFRGGTANGDGLSVQGTGPGLHCVVWNQPVGSVAPPEVSGNYGACNPNSADVTPIPTGDMIVYLQAGDITRQNSDFIAPQTFFYQESDPARGGSTTSRIDLGGGTVGTLLLTAPLAGNFKNLSIWSENFADDTSPNRLGAQNKIALQGILFLPNGTVEFGGDPTYLGEARAQFVAWRLRVFGGGTLQLYPDKDRTLTIPVGGVRLIR